MRVFCFIFVHALSICPSKGRFAAKIPSTNIRKGERASSPATVASRISTMSSIVVNEVGDKGALDTTCGGNSTEAGEDYIELKNTGMESEDISGYILHDDNGPDDDDAYTFPNGTVLPAGGLLLLCRDDSFAFGIGGSDTISIVNATESLVSTSGALDGSGTEILSYQRLADGTYEYRLPTPGTDTAVTSAPSAAPVASPVPAISSIVVNEVGDKGTFDTCGGNSTEAGEDYIELKNTGMESEDISGYILHDDNGPDDDDAYTFPNGTVLPAGGLLLLCRDDSFAFGIGGSDTISIVNATESLVSTSGALDGNGTEVLSFQRLMEGGFTYRTPTPGKENLEFTAVPSTVPSNAPTTSTSPSSVPVVSQPSVVLNEIGSSGTFNVCGGNSTEAGEDYIEIKNIGMESFDVSGYKLHDDKGLEDDDTYTFPNNTVIQPNALLLLCRDETFEFGIGGEDTVSLADSDLAIVSTAGPLDGSGNETISYQRQFNGEYEYKEPTPGRENIDDDAPSSVPSVAPSQNPVPEPTAMPTVRPLPVKCVLFCGYAGDVIEFFVGKFLG